MSSFRCRFAGEPEDVATEKGRGEKDSERRKSSARRVPQAGLSDTGCAGGPNSRRTASPSPVHGPIDEDTAIAVAVLDQDVRQMLEPGRGFGSAGRFRPRAVLVATS